GQMFRPSAAFNGNLPFAGNEAIPAPAAAALLPELTVPAVRPRMAPELALDQFAQRSAAQSELLLGYSAESLIRAELPETSQRGEFEVERHFAAPRSLAFKALR